MSDTRPVKTYERWTMVAAILGTSMVFLDGTVSSVYKKKLPVQDSYVFEGIDKLGFAFPKGSALRADFDKYLYELGPEKRQAIIDKWMK